jgi:hypothetical protein
MFGGESNVGRHLRKRFALIVLFPSRPALGFVPLKHKSTSRGLTTTSSPTSMGSSDDPLLKGAEVRSVSQLLRSRICSYKGRDSRLELMQCRVKSGS